MAAPKFVLLAETADPVELATWRSLLAGAQIQHIVQAEHHASLLAGPLGNPAIVPRILVLESEVDQARELLSAGPDHAPSASLDSNTLCPVHEKPAFGVCDRCGTFLCSACSVSGTPPLCESCSGVEERAFAEQREKSRAFKRRAIWAILLFFIGLPFLIGFITDVFGTGR